MLISGLSVISAICLCIKYFIMLYINIYICYIVCICVLLFSLIYYVYIDTAIRYMPLVFTVFFHLCHNLCVPGKTYLLLLVPWSERERHTKGVIVCVSLGGKLGFRTLPIKSIRKFFYYPEIYSYTDKTRYWYLIKKKFLTLISTGQYFKN